VLYFVLQEGKTKLAGIFVAMGGLLYLGWLALQPGRFFPIKNHPKDIFCLEEKDDCGCKAVLFECMDGILFTGEKAKPPFKISKGVDVVVAGPDCPDYGTVREAGPGSWLVNRLNGGGYIEAPDDCWHIFLERRK
jgi:hypothetical protein